MDPSAATVDSERPMTRDTRIALFLMGELVAALRAIDPCLLKLLLSGDL